MTEPTITCPNRRTAIKLTESLAAPLIASTRQQFEAQLAKNRQSDARRRSNRDQTETPNLTSNSLTYDALMFKRWNTTE